MKIFFIINIFLIFLTYNIFGLEVSSKIKQIEDKLFNDECIKKYENINEIKINIDTNLLNEFYEIDEVEILSQNILPEVDLLIKGKNLKKQQIKKIIKSKIKLFGNIVIASRTILKGEKISLQDIKLAKYNILKLNAQPFYSIEALKDKITNKVISLNNPITIKDINYNTVKIGDVVDIIYKNNFITIIDKGRIEQEGKLNEKVKVRNIKSGKLLEAIIIANDKVLIIGDNNI